MYRLILNTYYLLLIMACFSFPGIVSAETVNSNSIITKYGEPKIDRPQQNQSKDSQTEEGLSETKEAVWPTKRGMVMYDSFVQTHTTIDAIDIVGVDSTDSVFSTHSGEVIFAGWDKINNGTYGNMVMVKSSDNKFISLYGHMSQILTKQGEKIKKGSLVGKVGSTSSVPGFANLHLHYEHRLIGSLFGIIGRGPKMEPPILPKLIPFRCNSPVFCNTKW